jgi:formylglycine-generating enzyme required for sulfatase activity
MTRNIAIGSFALLTLAVATLAKPVRDRDEQPKALDVDLGGGVAMKFVRIEPGTFQMGSVNEPGRNLCEIQRQIEITQPFYLGIFEVTQKQFRQLMNSNPSFFSGTGGGANNVVGLATDDFPVEQATWTEAMKFCDLLTRRGLPAGLTADLPTEAEWEYACRAGTRSLCAFGDVLDTKVANIATNPGAAGDLGRTTTVGSYKPNAWGLYDMHGNVEEWCKDWYGDYLRDEKMDPQGPKMGGARVLRGGSWQLQAQYGRSASRDNVGPEARNNIVGFRVALRLSGRR